MSQVALIRLRATSVDSGGRLAVAGTTYRKIQTIKSLLRNMIKNTTYSSSLYNYRIYHIKGDFTIFCFLSF